MSSENQVNVSSNSLKHVEIQAVIHKGRWFSDIKIVHDLVQRFYFNILINFYFVIVNLNVFGIPWCHVYL